MRSTMMPPPASTFPDWGQEITSGALDHLGVTDSADLFALLLPGETEEEAAARHQAASDILDDRLTEIAHMALTTDVARGWAQ